jgi:HPt (histidine-containing phosphotransfer) domain-containing protein
MMEAHVSTADSRSTFLYSQYGDDPDLAELVELFVEEMPGRIQGLVDCGQRSDWSDLSRIAHQLKGAAGSYGFTQITPIAQQLERAAREGTNEPLIRESLQELVSLCRLCRAGVPDAQ